MTITTIDNSQRKAAKLAGFAGIFSVPFVTYANFAIHARLIVEGNVAQTARNIVEHETLFRISIACDLIYSVGLITLLAALYVVLKPVDRTLSAGSVLEAGICVDVGSHDAQSFRRPAALEWC